ncbi:MAG: VOC family protein [Thermomicrobiales bacterium]
MTIQRMDNVGIVVDNLDAAIAFFTELGMEQEGRAMIEGTWAARTVGLDGLRSEIAMMRTPDGHGKLELATYHAPAAIVATPQDPPPNTVGLHRVMFAVDDIDDTIARLRMHGGELPGEVAQYEDIYRLCYLRGPSGIIVGLAEQIN